jgi:hypothetical protein
LVVEREGDVGDGVVFILVIPSSNDSDEGSREVGCLAFNNVDEKSGERNCFVENEECICRMSGIFRWGENESIVIFRLPNLHFLEGIGDRGRDNEVPFDNQALFPQFLCIQVGHSSGDEGAGGLLLPTDGGVFSGGVSGADEDDVRVVMGDNQEEICGVAGVDLGKEGICEIVERAREVQVKLGWGDLGQIIAEDEDIVTISSTVAGESATFEQKGE